MITKEEKCRLNSEAAKIYNEAEIIPEKDEVLAGADDFYDKILEINGVGFAHYYLYRYKVENRTPDALVYKLLIQIDSKLGTTKSDQLYWCLENSTCPNLINVIILGTLPVFNVIFLNDHLLIQILDLDAITDRCGYQKARKMGSVGFAHLYLLQCNRTSDNNVDATIYKRLIDLDCSLGTTSSEQLFWCLNYTTCLDLIKVRYHS